MKLLAQQLAFLCVLGALCVVLPLSVFGLWYTLPPVFVSLVSGVSVSQHGSVTTASQSPSQVVINSTKKYPSPSTLSSYGCERPFLILYLFFNYIFAIIGDKFDLMHLLFILPEYWYYRSDCLQ